MYVEIIVTCTVHVTGVTGKITGMSHACYVVMFKKVYAKYDT